MIAQTYWECSFLATFVGKCFFMLFKEIVGQQEVKNKLVNVVQEGRVSHAQLFFGPPGTGKLALAIALAQYMTCTERDGMDSCGHCPSCLKFRKLIHPDVHFVFPVMTTQQVPAHPVSDMFMETWRESVLKNPYQSENQWYEAIGAENKQGFISKNESKQVIRKLSMKPYEAEYTILVIWLPEKMNHYAANSLLKLIEEPPVKTLFLLVSENTDQILPTILSRTGLFYVPPLGKEEIRNGLTRSNQHDPALIEDAVSKSNGNFSLALKEVENDERDLYNFNQFTGIMRLCYSRKIIEITEWVDQVAGIGRERQKQLLTYSVRLLRENFILHIRREDLTYLSKKESEFSGKFSRFIHEGNIFGLTEAFTEAEKHIEANGNARIILLDLAIHVIRLLQKKESESYT